MQEIVNYLVRNPEIVQKLRREEVSIIGLDKEEVKGVLLGFDQLISMSSKDEIYWNRHETGVNMKLSKNTYSILLILLSLSYIFYLTYINVNNLFVGATANVNNKNQIEITKVSDYTMAYYAGVKKGDIVIKINQNKSVEPKDLKQNTLKNVRSMTVERSGEIVDLKNLSLLSEDNLFVYLIPVIFSLYALVVLSLF